MSDFEIFSDGACDLSLNLIKEYGIKIIPFYVSFDGQNYFKEIEEISLNDFYDKIINNNVFPKTSLPSVQDYINAFTPCIEAGKGIICFTITDSLSGSYQSAEAAKQILEENFPNAKIYIINSWNATGSQSLILKEASRMKSNGLSIEEVYKTSEQLKKTARIFFMVGSLKYLEKGGRIGKLAALSGGLLSIKPLIVLKEGEINVAGVSRSRKKGIEKLAEITKSHFLKTSENPLDYIIKIGTTNTPEEVPYFESVVSKLIPEAEFLTPFNIGATISSHTGPDTIGICIAKKYENL